MTVNKAQIENENKIRFQSTFGRAVVTDKKVCLCKYLTAK